LESKVVSANHLSREDHQEVCCERIISVKRQDFAMDIVRAVGSLILVIVALVISVMATPDQIRHGRRAITGGFYGYGTVFEITP
jgi:hypothetical protein